MTDSKDKTVDQQATGSIQKESRRKALKTTLIGGAVISTGVLPDKWKKPVLDSVILPSHAETTGDTDSGGPDTTTTGSPNVTENVTFNFTFSDWVDEQVS